MAAIRFLLLLILMGRLPQIAGAGPLHVDLDVNGHREIRDLRRQVDEALARFGETLAARDSSAFAELFDPTRARLLLGRARDPDRCLDYGPWLQDWALGAEGGPAEQQELLRTVLVAAPPPTRTDARNTAVIHADRTVARRLWPEDGLMPLRIGHMQTRDAHPLLGRTLKIALRTDLPWIDPTCDPWRREFASRIGACPLNSGALKLRPPLMATERETRAWLDSVCGAEPAIAKAGWLKGKLLRWGVATLVRTWVALEGARVLWITGEPEALLREAALTPCPPVPPPADRAVLHLLFLPDSGRANRWLLALAWLTPSRREHVTQAYFEPGFAPWTRSYARWRELTLERIEGAEAQR